MDAPTTCTFCSSPATLVPTEECRVCDVCAKRIAAIAAARGASEIWDAPSFPEPDAEVEAFAASVVKQISSEDSDAHLNLAMAYRAMGMHARSLGEAAIALAAAEDARRSAAVLRLLLTPPLLRTDGVGKLRARLARMVMN